MTVTDLHDLARLHGTSCEVLEVGYRVWVFLPGAPTDRIRDAFEDRRPAGIELTVETFDDLNEVVEGLIAEAVAAAHPWQRAQVWFEKFRRAAWRAAWRAVWRISK